MTQNMLQDNLFKNNKLEYFKLSSLNIYHKKEVFDFYYSQFTKYDPNNPILSLNNTQYYYPVPKSPFIMQGLLIEDMYRDKKLYDGIHYLELGFCGECLNKRKVMNMYYKFEPFRHLFVTDTEDSIRTAVYGNITINNETNYYYFYKKVMEFVEGDVRMILHGFKESDKKTKENVYNFELDFNQNRVFLDDHLTETFPNKKILFDDYETSIKDKLLLENFKYNGITCYLTLDILGFTQMDQVRYPKMAQLPSKERFKDPFIPFIYIKNNNDIYGYIVKLLRIKEKKDISDMNIFIIHKDTRYEIDTVDTNKCCLILKDSPLRLYENDIFYLELSLYRKEGLHPMMSILHRY